MHFFLLGLFGGHGRGSPRQELALSSELPLWPWLRLPLGAASARPEAAVGAGQVLAGAA